MDRLNVSLIGTFDVRCSPSQNDPDIVKSERDWLEQSTRGSGELCQNEGDEECRSEGHLIG